MVVLTDKILEQAEKWHYKFQQGCYFSDSKKTQNVLLLWNNKIKDSYWNFATEIDINEKSFHSFTKRIIDFYKTKNRQPTLYFTPFTRLKNLPELAKNIGFKSMFKDVWMFYKKDKPKIVIPQNFVIKKVKTKEEMKIFVNIFNQAYSGATPEEPYGKLPKEYSECLFESFVKTQEDRKTVHYLGFLDGKPTGIVTLIYTGKFGCIYNLGTIPNHRKKGIGSALTLNAVVDSIENNAEIVFLQTEKRSFNEKYFTSLGFSTKFIGEGFVLE